MGEVRRACEHGKQVVDMKGGIETMNFSWNHRRMGHTFRFVISTGGSEVMGHPKRVDLAGVFVREFNRHLEVAYTEISVTQMLARFLLTDHSKC